MLPAQDSVFNGAGGGRWRGQIPAPSLKHREFASGILWLVLMATALRSTECIVKWRQIWAVTCRAE